VGQFDAALRAVDGLVHAHPTGSRLQALAVELRRVLDRVDVACTRALRAAVASGSPLPDGYLSVSSWWADAGITMRNEGTTRLAQHRVLDELPRFALALAEGALGVAHLRVLAPAVTDGRLELARRDDDVLTDAARKLDPNRFRIAVRHWQSLADDTLGSNLDDDLRWRRRRLRLVQQGDGMWVIEGLLEPLVGDALAEVLRAATPPPGPGDTRNAPQRRHDALADLVVAFQRGDDGAGVHASVNIHVHPDTGQASTEGGGPLPAWQRDWYLCDSEIRFIAVTDSGEPIGVGSKVKLIPVHMRKAVVARDRCCRFPGCDRPARWCDVHHLVARALGGSNALRNTVLLCRRHHRLVHRLGLRLRFEDDGVTLVVTFPDGIERVDHPPPKLRWAPTG
jgi:hypothetical protein